ncbi:MAG TPA: hypothetical protein VFY83_00655, partial [Anaerolineales bacterium]|nr:hypothetical protein [Anaerolineales bacterium]
KVAQHLGLKRRGTSLRLGQWGPVYGFADGSGVYVSPSGAFVDAEVHDYKARKKNNNHELD